MQFFPSIDIKDGKCVRLYKGRLETCKVYEDSPLDAIRKYNLSRANWLHIVDLDGAVAGTPKNIDTIADIIKHVKCRVQIGGGIRNINSIKKYLLLGASRIILGTAALTNLKFISKVSKKYVGKIAISLDTDKGYVAKQGWTKLSKTNFKQILPKLTNLRLSALIWTDISRDGTLGGVNVADLSKIINISKIPVIVSGGVSSLKDLRNLRKHFGDSIAGVISGKAIYEKLFSVRDAQKVLC
ncbi:1-(5-phosphoribosyl)-5-[(5- phosphoribosylamino)methylideneamino] imidazole-4-carboxamide isomerase [Candidatus Hodgkinia cicadicola]|nr:1-(5-phosphoribosyl)-5-[(5- phosphoribosylamino)methylideneamino] imidazole-4-carboxamide isomerase [Candidatus Hodgkinia cicadicola]